MDKACVLKEVLDENETLQDAIIFMTGYSINYNRKKFINMHKSPKIRDTLSKFHIECIINKDILITELGALKYNIHFDSYNQKSYYKFDVCDKTKDLSQYQVYMEKIKWFLALKHSCELLLDSDVFELPVGINMEEFEVEIQTLKLKVKPIVFYLNEILFVNYELVDIETGEDFDKEKVYGRRNNYNIIPVCSIRYAGEEKFNEDRRKISDIIFDNVMRFLEEFNGKKNSVNRLNYFHNILVISNYISDVEEYCENVLGTSGCNLCISNLNTSTAYAYFSIESIGVVTSVESKAFQNVRYDCQLLESLKMYIHLKVIVNFQKSNKLSETLDNQLYVEQFLLSTNVPIITYNMIENIKQGKSFIKHRSSVDFKIKCLRLQTERRKNRNALLMNILLYLLALLSGISTLEIFETKFSWNFTSSVIGLVIIFVIGGGVWIWQERK